MGKKGVSKDESAYTANPIGCGHVFCGDLSDNWMRQKI